MPPDHSTAARGTLPTEQTKLRTAITGPMITFSIVRSQLGPSVMNRPLKKSLPSSPMKPARKKPRVISFHSIFQSPTKFAATSVQASTERTRCFQVRPPSARGWSWPPSACWACLRASASRRGEMNTRRTSDMSTIRTAPPTNSASVNCQPSRTHRTSPSSHTRLVEANWKASITAADAPLANSERPMAMAAYEHEDEAAPSSAATLTGLAPLPARRRSMRSRGTQACTMAEMAKPSTSAHQTS